MTHPSHPVAVLTSGGLSKEETDFDITCVIQLSAPSIVLLSKPYIIFGFVLFSLILHLFFHLTCVSD